MITSISKGFKKDIEHRISHCGGSYNNIHLALLIVDGIIVAKATNIENKNTPCDGHAEMQVLKKAKRFCKGGIFLKNCRKKVTLLVVGINKHNPEKFTKSHPCIHCTRVLSNIKGLKVRYS